MSSRLNDRQIKREFNFRKKKIKKTAQQGNRNLFNFIDKQKHLRAISWSISLWELWVSSSVQKEENSVEDDGWTNGSRLKTKPQKNNRIKPKSCRLSFFKSLSSTWTNHWHALNYYFIHILWQLCLFSWHVHSSESAARLHSVHFLSGSREKGKSTG